MTEFSSDPFHKQPLEEHRIRELSGMVLDFASTMAEVVSEVPERLIARTSTALHLGASALHIK